MVDSEGGKAGAGHSRAGRDAPAAAAEPDRVNLGVLDSYIGFHLRLAQAASFRAADGTGWETDQGTLVIRLTPAALATTGFSSVPCRFGFSEQPGPSQCAVTSGSRSRGNTDQRAAG